LRSIEKSVRAFWGGLAIAGSQQDRQARTFFAGWAAPRDLDHRILPGITMSVTTRSMPSRSQLLEGGLPRPRPSAPSSQVARGKPVLAGCHIGIVFDQQHSAAPGRVYFVLRLLGSPFFPRGQADGERRACSQFARHKRPCRRPGEQNHAPAKARDRLPFANRLWW